MGDLKRSPARRNPAVDAKGRGDLAAAGARDGGRERGHRRLEEHEDRADDEEVCVHGPHPCELGESGGREVGNGRGGDALLPDGLRHGDGGGAEVLVILPLRVAEAGEDGRCEVGLAREQGEVGNTRGGGR